MKFTVQMKDPDVLYDAFQDAAKAELASIEGLSEHEREILLQSRIDKLGEFADKWFEYGKYVKIEFDTEAGTAVVVPRK